MAMGTFSINLGRNPQDEFSNAYIYEHQYKTRGCTKNQDDTCENKSMAYFPSFDDDPCRTGHARGVNPDHQQHWSNRHFGYQLEHQRYYADGDRNSKHQGLGY